MTRHDDLDTMPLMGTLRSDFSASAATYRLSASTLRSITIAPVIIVLVFSFLWAIPNTRPIAAVTQSENHTVELLTLVTLLCASIVGVQLARTTRRQGKGMLTYGFYAIFSATLFLAGMEEISWGQWLFDFEPPAAITAINTQGELNLHNLPGLHAPFEMLRIVYGLGGLAGVWCYTQRQTRDIGTPVALTCWFVLITILAALDFQNYFTPPGDTLIFFAARLLAEVLELLIGMSAALYMWMNWRRLCGAVHPGSPIHEIPQ